MQDAHHGWCGSKCPLLHSSTFIFNNQFSIFFMPCGNTAYIPCFYPNCTSPHLSFNDLLKANILVPSSLKMYKCVDVWWTACRTRGSSRGKICMFSWWVFMLSQKAVQMLFEDWLECKACSSASFEYAPCEFFSPPQQLFTSSNFSSGLLVDCFMLRFSLLTLWSSWRGQTSCLDQSWKHHIELFSRSFHHLDVFYRLMQIKYGQLWCITWHCSYISLQMPRSSTRWFCEALKMLMKI